jgi:hypothetical protein
MWFLLAVMMSLEPSPTNQDLFVFEKEFKNAEECTVWALANRDSILYTLYNQYNGRPVNTIICINENIKNQIEGLPI